MMVPFLCPCMPTHVLQNPVNHPFTIAKCSVANCCPCMHQSSRQGQPWHPHEPSMYAPPTHVPAAYKQYSVQCSRQGQQNTFVNLKYPSKNNTNSKQYEVNRTKATMSTLQDF